MRERVTTLIPLRIRRPLGRTVYPAVAGTRNLVPEVRSRIMDRLGGLPLLRARDLVYGRSNGGSTHDAASG